MATTTEPMQTGEFIAEDEGEASRDSVVVLSGQTLVAGEVVGKVTISGVGRIGDAGSAVVVSGTSPGDGTMTLITAGPDVEVGNYLVQCTAIATNNGTFSVTTPSGKLLHPAVMAAGTCAYKSSHLNFTLTDGSTDFALTALFTVTVGATVPTVIGGTGNGVLSALSLGPLAQKGNYLLINRVAATNGGDMELIAPNGASVARFIWANSGSTASFTSDHLNLTISDSTDYIAGNYFNICVYGPAAAPKVVQWDPNPTTYDGRHRVAGVMYAAVDASGGDAKGVIVTRSAVVKADCLTWKTTTRAAEQAAGKAALTALGVVVR